MGTYSIIFNDGHKMVSSQTLQAFDPGKVSIKEITDAVCHRPGTILGNYSDTYKFELTFSVLNILIYVDKYINMFNVSRFFFV